jgi:protein-S-isoprenylcysteine O-methyltransferase Ste14
MDNETIFRAITIALFVAILVIGVPHRVRAARSGEKISRRQEGLPIMVLLRLFGFSTWIGLLMYMVNPRSMAWSALSLPSWSRWVGAAVGVMTVALIYWMFSSLGKNVTDTVAIRKEHSLVIDGPYRWVRHPMYSATFLAVVGFTLLSANWFIGLTGVIALALLVVRTPVEERLLIEKFGDQYRQYMKRTGRFFPRAMR